MPQPKKKGAQLALDNEWTQERIKENKFINEVRGTIAKWRFGGHPGVTSTTRQLLEYWTNPARERRLFFCQIEALETAIYLTEIADRQDGAWILSQLKDANAGPQSAAEPRRLQDGHRQRQDRRDGHADRLAHAEQAGRPRRIRGSPTPS